MDGHFVSTLLRHAPLSGDVLGALAAEYPGAVLAHPRTSPALAATLIATGTPSDLAGALRQLAGDGKFELLTLALNRLAEIAPVEPDMEGAGSAVGDVVSLVAARAPHLLPDIIPSPLRTWAWVEYDLGLYGHYPNTPIAGRDNVAYRLISGRGVSTTDSHAASLLNDNPSEFEDFPQALAVLLLLRPNLLGLLTGTTGLEEYLPRVVAATSRSGELATHLQGPCTHQCPYVRGSAVRGAMNQFLSLLAMTQVPRLSPVHARELLGQLNVIAGSDPEDLEMYDDITSDSQEVVSLAYGALELLAPLLGGTPPRMPRVVDPQPAYWTSDRSGNHRISLHHGDDATQRVLAAEVLTELISRHEQPAAVWGVVLPTVATWPGTLVELVDAAAAVVAPATNAAPQGAANGH